MRAVISVPLTIGKSCVDQYPLVVYQRGDTNVILLISVTVFWDHCVFCGNIHSDQHRYDQIGVISASSALHAHQINIAALQREKRHIQSAVGNMFIKPAKKIFEETLYTYGVAFDLFDKTRYFRGIRVNVTVICGFYTHKASCLIILIKSFL